MLDLYVPALSMYKDVTNEFIDVKSITLQLEHSLVSVSKWESKWCKPFLSTELTREESIDYIRCMTIAPKKIDDNVYQYMPDDCVRKVNKYIEAPMTATKITKKGGAGAKSTQIVTSELIYYWMVAFHIPPEFEKWHLTRLMTLISVCDEENKPKEKVSEKEIMMSNAELNAKRRAMLNSKG